MLEAGLAEVGSIVWTLGAIVPLVYGAAALLFATAVLSIATVSSILLWGRGSRGPRTVFALLGSLLLWLVFSRGRTDQAHLVFLAPVFLYLLVQHVDWQSERPRVPLLRVWVALALLLMMLLRWPVSWLQQPPSIEVVRAVDAQWAERGLPSLGAELPGVAANDLAVLHRSQYGSGLYLQWSPVSPPVDWLQSPADRYNSPPEFQAIADFGDEHAVPYIVVPSASLELWLRDPSPIREMLRERYRRAFDTAWGVA